MSPYRTTVTQAMIEGKRNPAPSLHNGRAKPGIAKHHQGKAEDNAR
jgi:hypothetical protein